MTDTPMSDGPEREMRSEQWSAALSGRISRQRADDRHLCDVIVGCDVSDDVVVFPAHRCVLAAGSDYFAALFSSGLHHRGDDLAVRDDVWHVTVNTALLGVSRDVLHTVWRPNIIIIIIGLIKSIYTRRLKAKKITRRVCVFFTLLYHHLLLFVEPYLVPCKA